MNKLLMSFLLAFSLHFSMLAQGKIKFPALQQQIDSLAEIDQQVQVDLMNGFNTDKRDSLEQVKNQTFIRNAQALKGIIAKYGYPSYDLVGKESSYNFWLCVQHCDHDSAFQQKVLKLMKKAVLKKQANPNNYAYLTDRVKLNTGKAQIYGTQLDYTADGTAVSKNLKRPRTVNKRRGAFGLSTLEEYLDQMTEMHQQMNKKN